MRGCLPIVTGVINPALFSMYITALPSHVGSLSLCLLSVFSLCVQCICVCEGKRVERQQQFNLIVKVVFKEDVLLATVSPAQPKLHLGAVG